MADGHPTLAGLPERLFPVSPAKLDTWLDCPRKYRLHYLERTGIPQGRWARTMMGNAAHLALRSWWADELDDVDAALNVIDRSWDGSLFRDEMQSGWALERVRQWVRTYLDKQPAREVRGVERTVSTMTAHLTISGRVDRIDEREGRIVVVDYKTGRGELTDDDARVSRTLAIYADAVRRTLRHECFDVELHHLPTSTIARHRHTAESIARHLARADEIGVELKAAVEQHAAEIGAGADADSLFPATAGPLCGWCDFWTICQVGQAATARREPWAGVDESLQQDSGGEPE